MARPKEFNRDTALEKAQDVFWEKGFNATSTDDLRLAMGIGRQSFYDTFKGKREAYLEVVRHYAEGRFAFYLSMFRKADNALEGLQEFLTHIALEPAQKRKLGCLGISSICELGTSDKDLSSIHESSSTKILSLLEIVIKDAQKDKFIRKNLDPETVAKYLLTVSAGMRVHCKGGASVQELKNMAKITIDGLKV